MPDRPDEDRKRISLWVKVPYTLFVCVLVPVYWVENGPVHFLWGSDIALLVTVAALWLESRLLAGMMALGVVVPELVWNMDFFFRLITGPGARGPNWTAYMFDPKTPFLVRGLSLFHVVLPFLLIWMVMRLGYHRRALLAQTLLAWTVLPVSYLAAGPEKNINWVYGIGGEPQTWLPALVYLGLVMIAIPMFIYVPMHFVLKRLGARGW